MARDRSIALRVRSDVSDAVRGLEQVGRAAADIGDRSDDAGRKSQTLSQRVAQSARDQRQDWQTVGTALTTYGAAVTGVGALVLTTGINYNSLRQTATAAMTAVTGSTEGAAEQMRRLDEFGQTSWLMRDSLVRAQQQMTGFGISTEKVIPYMDALSEAVAASGGSSQEFEELARVMGQVQSQGRITAQELNQFGIRGVDAAQMIADAMGVTAGDIRSQITAGALDAETALDALAEGMRMNFEGSSDLVRNTFRGAVDDVMAAFRDLSASFVTPLVNPEGGGLFVGLLNQVSDLMRGIEQLPGPIRNTGIALGLLTGPASLAAGAFLLLAPRIVATGDALLAMGRWGPVAHAGIRAIGRAAVPLVGQIALVAAGFLAATTAVQGIQDHFRDARLSFDQLADSMARGDLSVPFERLSGAYSDLEGLGQVLLGDGLIDRMDRGLSNLNQSLGGFFPDDIATATDELERMGQVLANMALEDGDVEGAAQIFTQIRLAMGATEEELMEFMPAWKSAMDEIGDTSAITGSYEAWMEHQAAINEAKEAFRELAAAASESFGTVMDAYNEASAEGKATAGEWIEALREQIAAHETWESNIIGATERARELLPRNMWDAADGMIEALIEGGATAAEAAQLLVDMTDDEFIELAELASQRGEQTGEALAEGVENARTPRLDIDDHDARTGFEALVDDIEGSSPNTELHLDPRPAIQVFDAETGRWNTTRTDTFLNTDATMGMQVFDETTGMWNRTTTDTLLDLDPDAAVEVFDKTTGAWVRTTTDTLLDLDPALAERTFGSSTRGWRNTTTNTGLGVSDGPARAGVRNLLTWIRGQSAQVTVYHRSAQLGGADIARAAGGPVFGRGTETSDSILAALSHNEHVLSAREVRGLGGHAAVEQMRAMARAGARGFADGGTPAYRYAPTFTAQAPSVNVQAPSLSGVRVVMTIRGQQIEGVLEDIADSRMSASTTGIRRAARAHLGGVR